MTFTVLNIAYALARVETDSAGGAEQILRWLDEALIRAGHRSIVIAREGSQVTGTLMSVPDPRGSIEDWHTWHYAHEHHRAAIERALRELEIDLVHMHGLDFNHYLPRASDVPVLVTMHLPPHWYGDGALHPQRPGTFFNCVSATQRCACPPGMPLRKTIINGVPLTEARPSNRKRNFALVLGRVCPEKGIHVALDAARRANMPLLIGGQVSPARSHCDYFNKQIAPRLSRTRRFLGRLRGIRKSRLLAAANCLLVPSLAPETSSLVAMEALASGTPVIAFKSGALPEIIEHGRTGFLVETAAEMAEAMRSTAAIKAATCRATAEARFSVLRMTNDYLQLYRQLIEVPAKLQDAA